jgi:hypothetical protein
MGCKKLLAVVCLCLLLALAGCNGTKAVVVEVELENVSAQGEQVRFVGNASLEGRGHSATVHDVSLVFVADDGSTMRTIPIGSMTVNESRRIDRVGFNVTVAEPPKELRFRIGTVDIPDDTRLSVGRRKLVNEEELTYSPYNQTEY